MNGDTAPVSHSGGFDLTLQLAEEVVNDLVQRQLSDPLTLDPHSPAFLPRRILKNDVQSHLPFALDWGLPQLACLEGDLLAAAIPLRGGVRPPALNRNLTVSASATVRTPVRVASDGAGAPYAAIDTAAAKALELGEAKLGYALAELPAPVPTLDVGAVAGLLRPALAPALLDSLAHVRLSYALESLPLHVSGAPARHTTQRDQAEMVFEASRADARVISRGESKALALGVTLAGGTAGDLARMSAAIPAIPKSPVSNIALTLSNAGMNRLLAQLEADGRLRGSILLRRTGNSIAWAWEGLTCAFEEGVVAVAGRFTAGTLVDDVRLLLTCSLGQHGELMVTPVGGVINPTLNDLATESFRALLERLFRAAGAHEGETGLWQRFTVPGTRVQVEARAVAIMPGGQELTLLYQAPLKRDAPALPDIHSDPLTVAISQRGMPGQAAPGTPVTAELDGMIAGGIQPFDLSWSASPPGTVSATPDRVARVTGVPADLGSDGAIHALAETQARVADLLGRTATATATARYRAAPPRRQTQPSHLRPSPLRFVLPVVLIIALLTGGGVALANLSNLFPPGVPPVLDVSPAKTYQQTCTPVSSALFPISVTLDNTRNGAAITWSATVHDAAPGSSSEPWATLDTASGVIGGGHAHTLTFTPARDLCEAIFNATGGQRDFAVVITYRLAGQSSRQSGDLAAAGALAATSRQITLTDTVFAVNFGAYVGSGERPALEILQTCHDSSGSSAPPVSSFPITLDNSRSTAPVLWTLTIPEEAMVGATPDAGMEPWATTSTPSGSLDAGQRAQIVVSPLPDLCQRIPAGTAAVPFDVTVTVNGVAPITLLDVVTPPAPAANLTVTPVGLKQDCNKPGSVLGSVKAFTVTLNNAQSNVPVNWQASVVESITGKQPTPGIPTPQTNELWATLDISSGVLQPGPNGVATFVVTPSSDVCNSIPYEPSQTKEEFHVLITYSGAGSAVNTATIMDAITGFSPLI